MVAPHLCNRRATPWGRGVGRWVAVEPLSLARTVR